MPKPKKTAPNKMDLEILSALYYLGKGTATSLGKVIPLSKPAISDRLKWLEKEGYLTPPQIDISSHRLKKVYHAPPKEKLVEAVSKWVLRKTPSLRKKYSQELQKENYRMYLEIYSQSPRPAEVVSVYSDLPIDFLKTLQDPSKETERRLCNVIKFLRKEGIRYPFLLLFEGELTKVLRIDIGLKIVYLTGVDVILSKLYSDVKRNLENIKELSPNFYEKILAEICENFTNASKETPNENTTKGRAPSTLE